MLILGLGSNIGDRLACLRQAQKLLSCIPKLTLHQVSPLYLSDALLPDNAPSSWNQPYLNLAIKCETSLAPHDLLHQLKNVEYAIGRKPQQRHWGPRAIDIDILAWDDLVLKDETLEIPHVLLPERPFALWPLADIEPYWTYPCTGTFQGKTAVEICSRWGSRFTGEAPLHTKQILHRIDTPRFVGILNITPDSFSDGGKFPHVQAALHHAYHLACTGAEIIDIGAEATHPNAIPLSAEDEWNRLEPVLNAIKRDLHYMVIPPKISIDTRHPEVAEKALHIGIDWINDTSGLKDKRMREMVASSRCDCIVMHNLGIPADKNQVLSYDENPVDTIYQWGQKHIADLEKDEISREKIIFDVGIGFGKRAVQSLQLLKNITLFQQLNTRLLVGHSRKSFLNLFTNKTAEGRDIETSFISFFLSQKNIDYLRVHNVEMCMRTLKVAKAL